MSFQQERSEIYSWMGQPQYFIHFLGAIVSGSSNHTHKKIRVEFGGKIYIVKVELLWGMYDIRTGQGENSICPYLLCV